MICCYCKKEFTGRKRKYCSSECRIAADKENKRAQYKGKREKVCALCKIPLPKFKTRFCSDECRIRAYHIEHGLINHSEILTKECVICGKTFQTWRSRNNCCSPECRKEEDNRRAQAHSKRYKGITIDKNINLKMLAKRDSNQCQICGLYVDWNDIYKTNGKTVCGDMYPSIDHIKPISMGGFHSWDNIQLAHRRCNMRKGNKVS